MDNKYCYRYVVFVLLLILAVGDIQNESLRETVISTRIGSLKGITQVVKFDGKFKNVTSFLGIPYAKPPIFERRFSRPEPYGDLKNVPIYNATYYRPHCIQPLATYFYMQYFNQSEDCLFLNIFIPGSSAPLHNNTFAVMIYIHGGSFAVGGADVYSGDMLSPFNDVIVVTINYRLNVFGFLSSGEKYSGNYGLWDMKLAIQWVHDNIKDFGGDPTRVTLFGNSAGGGAVLFQAINPSNRGLFQRVIAQSGTCFAFWALQENPADNFNWYVTNAGCNTGTHSDMLNCLRKKPVEDLTLGYTIFLTNFVPAVDLEFLLEDPIKLSESRTSAGKVAMAFYSELDLLIGVLSQDGAYARGRWEGENINGVSRSYFVESFVPNLLRDIINKPSPVLIDSVLKQYTDWSRPNDKLIIREKVIDLESDITFFIPAIHASRKHVQIMGENSTERNNTYFYVFDHKPDFAPDPEWLTGATHAMELPYIFGFTKALEIKMTMDYDAISPFVASEEDIQFSKKLMTFWTDFAKTGNPNLGEAEGPDRLKETVLPEWPPYLPDTQLYLELSPNMSSQSVKHHFVASRVAFWENMTSLLKDCCSGSVSCHFSNTYWYTECLMIYLHMSVIYLIYLIVK
ncbi:bile salt-activated lipase-like [Mercenaria mercenaria]|uniref:bile salt-activated lipase-like n=1 Tax=Mercenaria mercenaria TaxID=6596 RepID=UPI00234EC109|nr:bile salt-activated lipase-like [Mercenaria mercenaria]